MDKPTFYQIKVRGHLDGALAGWFEDLTVENVEDGNALLSGNIQDQAALQGYLNRISNLGLVLISLNARPQEDETDEQRDDDE
jgi:hypothetical protein